MEQINIPQHILGSNTSELNAVLNRLVLLDEKTGRKWELKISDGELIIEPIELEDKREFKLNKILK